MGILADWLFNDGAGNLVWDYSYSRKTGSLINGATWGSGPNGSVVELDGINQIVDLVDSIPQVQALTTGAITICAKFDNLTGANKYLWSASDSDDSPVSLIGVYYVPVQGHLRLVCNEGGVSNYNNPFVGAPSINTTDFNIFTMIQNGIEPVLVMNGKDYVMESSFTDGTAWFNTVTDMDTFRIGNRKIAGADAQYLDGAVDRMIIHDQPLTIAEAKRLHFNIFAMYEYFSPGRFSILAPPPVGAIMNQFQGPNLGADLFNGAIM